MTFQVALRTACLAVFANIVIVLLSLTIGQQIETSTITEYMTMNEVTYAMQIRDLRTNTTLRLAGTRCFAMPSLDPEWIAVRQQYQTNYVDTFQLRAFQAENAVERLECP